MAERVVLHVGLMKSGTTYLQGCLNTNRELLAEQGILFPGPTWRRHSQAVTDLIGGNDGKPGAWASLRDEIHGHAGTAIVSMEYLGPMPEARIAGVTEDFAGTDVHVVLTVRDLGRAVPAMWQEAVKNRQTRSWPDYVHAVQRGGEAGKKFWRQQSAARIVDRWAAGFGIDHVTVITVPPPDAPSVVLWDRFREVAGITDTMWQDPPRANESLGVASVALMRLLNEQTRNLSRQAYKKRVKALAKHVLALNREREERIGFTVPGWLHQRASAMTERLSGSGVRIVGGLEELVPLDVPGVDPSSVSAEKVSDAAVAAISTLIQTRGPVKPVTVQTPSTS